MKAYVIYCHGYASSSQTSKVQLLQDAGFDTKSWDLNGDPEEVLYRTAEAIDDLLIDNLHEEVNLVFVGTSLGAWYAAKLARMYGSHAVLVNPAFSPSSILPRAGADSAFAALFDDIVFDSSQSIFVAEDDELIDFFDVDFTPAKVTYTPTGGHRFIGPEFNLVIEEVRAHLDA